MVARQQSAVRSMFEWITMFVIAFCIFFGVRTFVAQPYRVPTGSMSPTIEIGDQVFAQKVTIELGLHVKCGDVVVFRNPNQTSSHDILVKRVIATGGQTVGFEDGQVTVDGVVLDEPYAVGVSRQPAAQSSSDANLSFPYTVPEGDVWVMGDNRESSTDSRVFGPVTEQELIGVAFLRYWPLSRIGIF